MSFSDMQQKHRYDYYSNYGRVGSGPILSALMTLNFILCTVELKVIEESQTSRRIES